MGRIRDDGGFDTPLRPGCPVHIPVALSNFPHIFGLTWVVCLPRDKGLGVRSAAWTLLNESAEAAHKCHNADRVPNEAGLALSQAIDHQDRAGRDNAARTEANHRSSGFLAPRKGERERGRRLTSQGCAEVGLRLGRSRPRRVPDQLDQGARGEITRCASGTSRGFAVERYCTVIDGGRLTLSPPSTCPIATGTSSSRLWRLPQGARGGGSLSCGAEEPSRQAQGGYDYTSMALRPAIERRSQSIYSTYVHIHERRC
jgi:hypothetical protein